ncbi:L-histidine N(alpha)-methyltransferase [Actinoplanes couchii]|uniref:L-histidine N(alpha)-methyltransferase n=1 Tax=Actinoplanes couchii TaxID=403638 RepID=UPI001940D191|nr:L-histidine N(alpha)-methyltransferase [Actinoplanes couchii]MDR6321364.1 L-histidine N-alpha-methyltransferase [Actinoplanes couchii]
MTGIDVRVVTPHQRFLWTYTRAQADVVADSLALRREFPQELTYLGSGAELWRAATAVQSALLRASDLLLSDHAAELADLARPGPVDVLDLGPGTGSAAEGLLAGLIAAGRFGGYRAVDISPEMLTLAGARLTAAFPARAARLAFTVGDFRDAGPHAARIVLLAGGTLFNLADPGALLRDLAATRNPGDLVVITTRLDTTGRAPFPPSQPAPALPPIHRLGLDLLNLDPGWYEPERGFDPARREVWSGARLNRPITLHLDGAHGRRVVALHTGDLLLLYRQLFLDRAAVTALIEGSGLRLRTFHTGRSGEVAMFVADTRD